MINWEKIKNKEIVAIYKPKGWPSFRVISYLRQKLGIKKIGFLGTLDPAAEGVLAVGIGAGTKKLKDLPKDKEYLAQIAFGLETETWDLEAKEFKFSKPPKISKKELEKTLKSFEGKIEQVIPMFSAKQIHGQRLYKLARAGKTLDKLPTKIVEIYQIKFIELKNKKVTSPESQDEPRPTEQCQSFGRVANRCGREDKILPVLTIKVACGSGTFIRSLAYELGQKLNTTATLISLIRTKDGGYNIKEAIKLPKID
jgi:tRNA pseudouridine55 synthase